jgi:hypothetical protein
MDYIERTDDHLVHTALEMWANHIETGNVTLSTSDFVRSGRDVKELSEEQQTLVSRLRKLSEKYPLY